MRERLLEQPVREPRIARQERAVQIRPDRALEPAPLEAAAAVVAEARDHPAERLGAGIEPRATCMVLEAGDRARHTGLELCLDQHVADHAALARDGLQWEQPDARHVLAVEAAVAASEQLIAAADRQKGRAAPEDGLLQRLGLRDEVAGDEHLLPVLSAADVVEVVRARLDRVAHPECGHVELVAAERGAPGEDRDVAAVGVDIQVVGIEVAYMDSHAARSQYGGARPRSATSRWSASMAV
jgi:hypothetical protein